MTPVCSFQRTPESDEWRVARDESFRFRCSLTFSGSVGVRGISPSLATRHPSRFFGGHKAVVRPDPIPNSAVKHSLADGSGCIASARVGCRQIFLEKAETQVSAFSLDKLPGLAEAFRLEISSWRIIQLESPRKAFAVAIAEAVPVTKVAHPSQPLGWRTQSRWD